MLRPSYEKEARWDGEEYMLRLECQEQSLPGDILLLSWLYLRCFQLNYVSQEDHRREGDQLVWKELISIAKIDCVDRSSHLKAELIVS